MAITIIGSVAAAVPIAVPITNRVNGIIKITSSKNGNERIMFTSKFKDEKTSLFSSNCPLRHRNKNVPMGSPTNNAANTEKPTIIDDSTIDSQISD